MTSMILTSWMKQGKMICQWRMQNVGEENSKPLQALNALSAKKSVDAIHMDEFPVGLMNHTIQPDLQMRPSMI